MGAKTNREGVTFGGAFEGMSVDTLVIHQQALDGLQGFLYQSGFSGALQE